VKNSIIEVHSETFMYPRNYEPFGESWEKWAALWCNWLLSIPKDINPAVDETGKNSSQNQNDENVWFLAGTFGNNIPVRRKCTVPKSKAILFTIADKEDSFVEDPEFIYEDQLSMRARTAMDRLIYLELVVDGKRLQNLEKYRVHSDFFYLTFPKNNVYGVKPGTYRSVCDGYWAFLRPLPIGSHKISFSAAIFMPEGDPVTTQIKNDPIYSSVLEEIDKNSIFNIDVVYDLTVE
jgi:hypothetical protein